MPEMPAVNGDSSGKYSEHFWEYEFDCKDGTPVPEDLQEMLKLFVQQNLEPLRKAVGAPIYILSAYRHEEYNKKVGGAKRSYHVYDNRPGKFAVDIMCTGLEPATVKFLLECLIRVGLIEEGGIGLYKNFVHYDNGPKRRW